MNRIQKVSRVGIIGAYAFFLFTVGFFSISILSLPSLKSIALRGVLLFIYHIALCIWYWKLAQLFRLYERGQIFTAATIRCIRQLGLICVTGAVFVSGAHFFPKQLVPPISQTPLPPGVTEKVTVILSPHFGFFSFDFGTGVDFGLILSGVIIVLIAWIMDEGRKIQEEQELTV